MTDRKAQENKQTWFCQTPAHHLSLIESISLSMNLGCISAAPPHFLFSQQTLIFRANEFARLFCKFVIVTYETSPVVTRARASWCLLFVLIRQGLALPVKGGSREFVIESFSKNSNEFVSVT
jgi:hypothetical protein